LAGAHAREVMDGLEKLHGNDVPVA
jgi:hypothetical protein